MALTLRKKRTDLPIEAGDVSPSLADEILDEILPEEIDWRQIVWSYPKSTLTLAVLGGYLLGRSRGPRILGAASEYVGDTVSDSINELAGRKIL